MRRLFRMLLPVAVLVSEIFGPLATLKADTSSSIVINEFLPDPASGNEFVEITNIGNNSVDISGWWIDDIEGGSSPKAVPANTILSPGSFFVMEFSSVFNNGGDSVRILAPDKTELFSYSYTSSVKGQSYNRLEDGTCMLSSILTPGAANTVALSPSPSPSPSVSATPLPATIVINEFLPDPVGPDSTDEFIEIANMGDGAVDISGWKVDDGEGGSTPYVIPPGTVLHLGAFLVFYSATTPIELNNSGDTVRLLGPDDAPIFSFSYTNSSSGKSYQRQHDGTFLTGSTLTPGAANPAIASPSPIPSYDPTAVIINEFLVNPQASDTANEFIELKNISPGPVDISGWQLDDADGGSAPFTIPAGTSLAPATISVWYRLQTKVALNNTGDSVRLLLPTGVVAASFTYTTSVKDNQSYNYRGTDEYALSTTATPGEENIITAPPEKTVHKASSTAKEKKEKKTTTKAVGKVAGVRAVKLAEARKQKAGEKFTTQGVVSVKPGVLGKQIFYVAGSGIQVYLNSAKFPALAVGDTVQLTGQLTSNRGEARLKLTTATDVIVVSHGPVPSPHTVTAAEVAEAYEGSLVTVTGIATHITKTGITLAVADKEVNVVLQAGAGIGKLPYERGTALTITGIVSQTTSGYRLLPRGPEDIQLAGKVAGAATKKLTRFPNTGGYIDVYVIISWWWAAASFLFSGLLLYKAHQANEPLINKIRF